VSQTSGLNRLVGLARKHLYVWSGVVVLLLACGGLFLLTGPAAVTADEKKISFDMIVSTGPTGAEGCLPDASAQVKVEKKKGAEEMEIKVSGLPPNTVFDVFVIQQPTGPFGMAWYQGDITTNHEGKGHGKFLGRFNNETFVVAPGSVAAPQVHTTGVIKDANPNNPATNPVHMYHLGLWFDSFADAANAGCPGNQTPFNGDHTAGIQVLNTNNFPAPGFGPLFQLD